MVETQIRIHEALHFVIEQEHPVGVKFENCSVEVAHCSDSAVVESHSDGTVSYSAEVGSY